MTGPALLAEIVAMVAASGGAELRRIRARAVYGTLALVALVIGLGFGLVALSLWLTEHMAPWQAALLAGGVALLLAGGFLLAARGAAARPPRADLAAQARALLAQVAAEGGDMTPMARITAAVAAGIVIGRMLSR